MDDLYPKAKFLDALGMVEKAGHTRQMRMARMEWIDEGKPRDAADENEVDDDGFGEPESRDAAKFPARVAPIFHNGGKPGGRPATPSIDDLFADDDLYDATPKASGKAATGAETTTGQPDDDEEDLDALMAEEEAQRTAPVSIFGNGQVPQKLVSRPAAPDDDDDDLDALMAEAEAMSGPTKATSNDKAKRPQPAQGDEEDDLDALMAEAEGQNSIGSMASAASNKEKTSSTTSNNADEDEEEAMAEMDGLW